MRTEITEDGERQAHYRDNCSLAGTIAQQLAPAVLDNRENRVTRTQGSIEMNLSLICMFNIF